MNTHVVGITTAPRQVTLATASRHDFGNGESKNGRACGKNGSSGEAPKRQRPENGGENKNIDLRGGQRTHERYETERKGLELKTSDSRNL